MTVSVHDVEGKVGCQGAAEGMAAWPRPRGREPEVGAGPGPRVGL